MAKFLVGGFVYEGSGTSKKLGGVKLFSNNKQVLTNKDGYYELELDTNEDSDLTAEKDGYFGVTKRAKKEKGDITLLNFNLEKELQLSPNPTPSDNTPNPSEKSSESDKIKVPVPHTTKNYLVGGASGLILGTTAYFLSGKILKNKWGQLGVATASALIFYFVGFNVSTLIDNKKNIKK